VLGASDEVHDSVTLLLLSCMADDDTNDAAAEVLLGAVNDKHI